MRALIASIVSVVAIIVLRELAPWRRNEDDIVAYAGYWLVFFWLFALLAYVPLEALPGWVWGTPLALLTIAFVAAALKKGRDEIDAGNVEQLAEHCEPGCDTSPAMSERCPNMSG